MKAVTILFLLFASSYVNAQNESSIKELDSLKNRIDSLETVIFNLKYESLLNERDVEIGQCYVRCNLQPQYEMVSNQYPIYTGNNYQDKNVRMIIINETPKSLKLSSKRISTLCKHIDDDYSYGCDIVCYEDAPLAVDTIYIVTDTFAMKEFKMEVRTHKELIKEQGYTRWAEFDCPCTGMAVDALVAQIQEALIDLGYKLELTNKMDRETKNCLVDYQKKNELPIGQLDFETLKSLGIKSSPR